MGTGLVCRGFARIIIVYGYVSVGVVGGNRKYIIDIIVGVWYLGDEMPIGVVENIFFFSVVISWQESSFNRLNKNEEGKMS